MNPKGILNQAGFTVGLTVSLISHAVFFTVFTPIVRSAQSAFVKSQFIFLGDFLTPSDLVPALPLSTRNPKNLNLDFSTAGLKDIRPTRQPMDMAKPGIKISGAGSKKPVSSGVLDRKTRDYKDESVSFGFSDYKEYLGAVDFSDLKKLKDREELAPVIDFKVNLNSRGEVVAVRRVASSGDPSVDLSVAFKLKNAVFRIDKIGRDGWLDVRVKIKD